jgi:hypothetical protein
MNSSTGKYWYKNCFSSEWHTFQNQYLNSNQGKAKWHKKKMETKGHFLFEKDQSRPPAKPEV